MQRLYEFCELRLRSGLGYLSWPLAVAAGVLAMTILSTVTPALGGGNVVVAMYQPDRQEIPAGTARAQWTDSHCGRCHQIDPMHSHPIDVTANMPVPAGLPLTQGKVTCITCHDSRVEAHAEARIMRTPMLRDGLTASTLCVKCHNPLENTRISQHGSSLGRAHFAWAGRKDASAAAKIPDGIFDRETQMCLSCHDGTISTDAGLSSDLKLAPGTSSEHPIGVSLAKARAAGDALAAEMRSPAEVDQRVRLFDGKVGCTSCHSPFSREKGLLVMSNHRSGLCLSCHAL